MAGAAGLSPEVEWYLEDRGYVLPEDSAVPLWRTEEPGSTTEGAVFDPERVDRVIRSLRVLKHTKGRWSGQPLEPIAIQVAYFIAPVFGWVHENGNGTMVRVIQEAYFEMPRKSAKALEVSTPLLTQRGWVPVSDVNAGVDSVFGPDGILTEVTHTSEVFTDRELFEVTTSDGRKLTVDGEHLWTVKDRSLENGRSTKTNESKTMTTSELIARGVTYGKARPANRFILPKQEALAFPAAKLPVDPYLLGYWLGDGFSSSGRFAVGAEDISAFEEMFKAYKVTKVWDRACWRVTIHNIASKLWALGLKNNKHIPDAYLYASEDDRLALLQGLMDSDGTIGATKNKAAYCGANEALVRQVLWLVRSLGYRANIGTGDAKIDGRTVGRYHRVSFTAQPDRNPFRLARKANRVTATSVDARRFTVTISTIEPIGRGSAKCIKVARDDGLFLAGKDLIVTHNTTLASGLGMYLAFADGENGAEVVFGAASKDQAGAAFRPVEALARSSKALKDAGIVANKTLIEKSSTTSTLKAVSSRGDLAHGANIHGALIDELHVHKNGDLLEAIESGTGAREQPLTIIITTADDGQLVGVYAQRRDMMEKVCNGVLKQPATYAVIFAAPDDADPFSETVWQKANPLYPATPTPEFMRKASDKARSNPVALASFLRLHLGIRAKQGTRYIPLEAWDIGTTMAYKEGDLLGRMAYGGLDLSSVSDLTALAWLFPDEAGGYDALYRFWLPEGALDALDAATANTASTWVDEGWITLTPGDVVDYDWIRATVVEDAIKFRVVEIGYDRWNSSQMVIDLQDKEGMTMAKVGQGIQSMSPALKEMNRLVRLGKFHAGPNPVMRWMVDNLRVASDPAGNVKPDKSKSTAKIDGVSATLDALFCAMSGSEGTAESAYENRGLVTL